MHRALYRTYRPAAFSEVVGQDHVTHVLASEVKEHRTSHAYLFCGSRGTGKTTCAKILAKAINCLDPQNGDPCGRCENCRAIEEGAASDIMEMDAASNTGVDYIRDIKDAVMYAPSMLKSRVYIIDEVHMLTPGAFNALLKTLEEPPAGVVFILATTEMQKIPATILSRCQCFEFRRIAASVIADRLLYIAENEKIDLEEDAAHLIARSARGGMRDAISLLETCSAHGGKVDVRRVEELSGGISRKMIEQTVSAIVDKDARAILELVARFYESSGDFSVYLSELIDYYRDMTVSRAVKDMPREELRKSILDLTEGEYEKMEALCAGFRYETLLYHISVLDAALLKISGKVGMAGRVAVETALLRLTVDRLDASPEALLARIEKLEEALLYGADRFALPAPVQNAGQPSAPQAQPLRQNAGLLSKEPPREDEKELFDFADAVHAYAKTDPAGASFLTGARAVAANGRVKVYVKSSFALKKLQSSGAAETLSGILTSQYGRAMTVAFVAEEEKQKKDLMDDLG